MEKVRLGDICVKQSSKLAQKDLENMDGSYPIFGASGLIKKINTYDQKAEYVAVVKDGAGVGRTMLLPAYSSVIGTLQYLIPNDNVNAKYLYYAVKSRHLEKYYTGSAIPHIYFKDYKSEPIILFDGIAQKKIALVLERVEKIIEKHKQQLEMLDTLIKARFVEMFGDATNNNKDWETASVESVCQEILGGGTPSKAHPEYYEGGDIPWVSSKDMKADVLYDSQIRINKLGVENSAARMVPVNSVIMVIRSGILKHSLPVAINAVPLTVNQDLKVFVPGDRIITRFMATQFKMQEKKILAGVRAVTADNIEFNSLKQRLLIIPPIELQNEFVSFAEQVDKSKVIAIFFLKSKQNIHIEMQKI